MHVMTCKSGYDHVSLHPLAERYLHGLSWNDCYFVYTTLPFGWKASAFVYHSIGLLAILATCIRSLGVPCTQYIDDRHIGQLVTPNSYPWSDLQKVEAAAYIATSIVTSLGYTLPLPKSRLTPAQSVRFLRYLYDYQRKTFVLPDDKKLKFKTLRGTILPQKEIDLKSYQ